VRIEFAKHFWDRFEWRKEKAPVKLTRSVVLETIENPDIVMQDPRHPSREWRIKKINGYCLKVVVEIYPDRLLAITLFFDRNLRRKGLCK
jgi:hypothetical protein